MSLNNSVNQDHMVRSALFNAEARSGSLESALDRVISAWEALPAGNYSASQIDRWLNDKMKPAIDLARRTR